MHKQDASQKQKHRVFIVDDHPIIRSGLAHLIDQEPDFSVCGDAGNAKQALTAIEDSPPDIAIIDISLRHSSGIRLIENLSLYQPDVSTLAYSMHDEPVYAERCLKAGAKGYITKQEPSDNVLFALRKIVKGDIHINDRLSKDMLRKFVLRRSTGTSPIDLLTNSELEVFQLVGWGMRMRNIAEELTVSVKTIETHTHNIKKKMNFKDLRELVMHAVKYVNKI